MYRDARKKPKAASKPSERDYPFTDKSVMGEKSAKNDPVGKQEYSVNAYGGADQVNYYDRS